jgi:uncharacterized membrane protein (DUF373 family)
VKRSFPGRLLRASTFLRTIDRSEQLLAKLLGLVLLAVTAMATLQLIGRVIWLIRNPATSWLDQELTRLLGDLLNLLIAMEVLQNITSYLRRHVVQIELVLITAMTAVARKVIVLPQGSENKPMLLIGLGAAVLALAGAYWLVRRPIPAVAITRTEPARPFPEPDRSPAPGDDGGVRAAPHHLD